MLMLTVTEELEVDCQASKPHSPSPPCCATPPHWVPKVEIYFRPVFDLTHRYLPNPSSFILHPASSSQADHPVLVPSALPKSRDQPIRKFSMAFPEARAKPISVGRYRIGIIGVSGETSASSTSISVESEGEAT